MSYTLKQICEILKADAPRLDSTINILLTDSRSLTDPDHSIFFAITTPSADGHIYIPDLYDKGVRAFCVSRIPDNAVDMPGAHFIVVPSTVRALQTIAAAHRQTLNIPIIGITGSRGKTTVKEWLYQLLSPDFNIVRSPRSFNSQIGVPLSIWETTPQTQLAIIEAGISRRDEMDRLQSIIRPTIGIITSIGHEHDEGFSSIPDKIAEKAILMRSCECVVFNGDNPLIPEALSAAGSTANELTWSATNPSCPLYISRTIHHPNSTTITFSYLSSEGQFSIPFTSKLDIENAISCLAVMLYLNIPFDIIASRMQSLTPVGTRLKVLEGVNSCILIHDTYTSDLHSLPPALDFMARHATSHRTPTVILSDVLHEDLQPARLYRQIAELLKSRGIARVIGIGPEISAHSRYFPADSIFYPSTSAFLTSVSPGDFASELILIKGASRFNFNLITDMLEARQHETILEVNLDNLIHNFNFFRSQLRPTTGIVCMVKASGYGAGSYELAKALQAQGAAYLAVAVADEGVDLRKSGITMPIMVLNPRVVNYKTLFAYNLEPEIYTFEILQQFIREGEKYGITDYPVHIKLDTGMHRLGFLESDIEPLISILHNQKVLRPASVFSHLAAADDPGMDDYTISQFEYFKLCADKLQSGFRHHIMRHILNSTGISRFPEQQFDLVRLGICLYGIPTLSDGSQADLRPVSSLYSTIISIKDWPAGTTIGYNRRGLLTRPSRIATVPVGYADGIDRHLGNGAMSVIIGGHKCPTVGNICMDIMMVDVTDTTAAVGDSVEIFGPNQPVTILSDILSTIPYEILTSISMRVKRLYYRE